MILHTRKKEFKKKERDAKVNGVKAKSFASNSGRRIFLDEIRKIESYKNIKQIAPFECVDVNNFYGLSGVYLLIKENKIVYIGESSCVITRIGQHVGNKIFDQFKFIPVSGELKRLQLEKDLIRQHSPIYNIMHNSAINTQSKINRVIIEKSID